MTRVALVTGGMGGLGEAVCIKLAALGYKVVTTHSPGNSKARDWLQTMNNMGYGFKAYPCDVADFDSCKACVERVTEEVGPVDVLVNNAGIMQLSSIADADDASFDRMIAVNLKGTFNGLREAARRLRNGGRIVNFSTSVVGLKLENYGVYAATKAAVETMTAILSKELRGRNITVNAVAPGPTATDLFLSGKSPELIERMFRMAPLERLGQPADIAGTVAFLAGPDGGWINGQVLRANGGIV